jgi:hypothetical protein
MPHGQSLWPAVEPETFDRSHTGDAQANATAAIRLIRHFSGRVVSWQSKLLDL